MISQTVEYALRAIVCLAATPDQPQTAKQMAAATRVPLPYLSKVLQGLAREGLVDSQRGLHGGFTLARSPETLTVLDVVNAVDPLPRLRDCPLGIRSHGANLCPLHRRLDDAVAMVERSFAATTVAELLRTPTTSHPLCEDAETAREPAVR